MANKGFVAMIKFEGQENHEKKSFKDLDSAIAYAEKNKGKIISINYKSTISKNKDGKNTFVGDIPSLLANKEDRS